MLYKTGDKGIEKLKIGHNLLNLFSFWKSVFFSSSVEHKRRFYEKYPSCLIIKVNGDHGSKARFSRNKKNNNFSLFLTQSYQKKALYRETSHLKYFYGDYLFLFLFFLSFPELDRSLNFREMLNIDDSVEYNSSKGDKLKTWSLYQNLSLVECTYRETDVWNFYTSGNLFLLSYLMWSLVSVKSKKVALDMISRVYYRICNAITYVRAIMYFL